MRHVSSHARRSVRHRPRSWARSARPSRKGKLTVELAADFKALLSTIQPGDNDVADAKAAHEKVREQLRTDDEFRDAHKDTFLSGSYARRTAINNINDVD